MDGKAVFRCGNAVSPKYSNPVEDVLRRCIEVCRRPGPVECSGSVGNTMCRVDQFLEATPFCNLFIFLERDHLQSVQYRCHVLT